MLPRIHFFAKFVLKVYFCKELSQLEVKESRTWQLFFTMNQMKMKMSRVANVAIAQNKLKSFLIGRKLCSHLHFDARYYVVQLTQLDFPRSEKQWSSGYSCRSQSKRTWCSTAALYKCLFSPRVSGSEKLQRTYSSKIIGYHRTQTERNPTLAGLPETKIGLNKDRARNQIY